MKNGFLENTLKHEIEIKRKSMYEKAKNLGFAHPQVVYCSKN